MQISQHMKKMRTWMYLIVEVQFHDIRLAVRGNEPTNTYATRMATRQRKQLAGSRMRAILNMIQEGVNYIKLVVTQLM